MPKTSLACFSILDNPPSKYQSAGLSRYGSYTLTTLPYIFTLLCFVDTELSCNLEVSLLEPGQTQIAQSQVPALTVVEAMKIKKITFGPKVNYCLTRLFGQANFFGNLAVLLLRIHGFASPHYYGFAFTL